MTATRDEVTCGVVMPISQIDGCSESHWEEVRNVHFDAIRSAGFKPRLVSDADEVGIIQTRIVQNLYSDPIAVVDVSAKNPNVMFELGLRLAFDKATVVVKDDETSYSFDTSPVEHVGYRRDLRIGPTKKFAAELARKIVATEKASRDESYSPFLKHFGQLIPTGLSETEVSVTELFLDEIRGLKRELVSFAGERRQPTLVPEYLKKHEPNYGEMGKILMAFEDLSDSDKAEALTNRFQSWKSVDSVVAHFWNNCCALLIEPKSALNHRMKSAVNEHFPRAIFVDD